MGDHTEEWIIGEAVKSTVDKPLHVRYLHKGEHRAERDYLKLFVYLYTLLLSLAANMKSGVNYVRRSR